jgi:CheY-like chemotaxis protein
MNLAIDESSSVLLLPPAMPWRLIGGENSLSSAVPLRSSSADLPEVQKDALYILVVEDNPADVSLLKQALAEHAVHIPVVVVNDGDKAMRFIAGIIEKEARAPQLVVLDLNLPKRNGREVLEFLRTEGSWDGVPVVILSSSAAARDKADAERLGASRYIRKPLDFDEFMAIGQALKSVMNRESA